MKKGLFSVVLMLIAFAFGAKAQQMPQLTPMPDMPGLRTGKLPNGLTYYVLHNAEPKDRANFYIAQKVGSTLETPEQLGLAHFLEHMAFNGSAHYPGKAMLNYLQGKGVRFGADINAYTGFDETVYRINNVDAKDVNLMDSCLLVLRDWSCDLLLEDTEIEAERGVIQEEWRARDNATIRMYTAMLPAIFEEYQYRQMPIGKMEVVMNFKPDVLRDYYHRWYRPDQQGIVVVGDFDAEEMEKKVIALFSDIPMPENAPERTYPEVSDNVEPIYFPFEDPELREPMIMVAFKSDKVPFEYRNTMEMYIQDGLLKSVLSALLNNRLQEYSHEADCDYSEASCYFGDLIVAKTKEAFFLNITPKGNNTEAAFRDAMAVITRACKTGFLPSELERVDSDLLAMFEKHYNERDKTNSHALGQEIIRHFIDNEPAPGAEMEYQIAQAYLPQIPVQVINQVASMLLTPENQVVVVSQPKNENFTLPSKETMMTAMQEVMNADYEAYVDEVITDPLLSKAPAAGKIVKDETNAKFGTQELTLSNGIKVVVKPTDFSNDEILVQVWREGAGMEYFPLTEASNLSMLTEAYDNSQLGNFNVKTLTKYLAGKRVALSLMQRTKTFGFMGKSSVKDLPTLLEMLYASFAELNPDEAQYKVELEKKVKQLAAAMSNPDYRFSQELLSTVYADNPMVTPLTVEKAEKADYNAMLSIIKELTACPSCYKMVMVGNVDLETVRPLLEQYVASIPSTGSCKKLEKQNSVSFPAGQISNVYDIAMQNPNVKVANYLDGELEYTMQNDVLAGLFGDIVDNNFTSTLREEEGGTYSPTAYATTSPDNQWALVYFFITNGDVAQRLQDRAINEVNGLINNGTNLEEFNKVREAAVTQLQLAERSNASWLSDLYSIERGYDLTTGRMDFLKSLTLDDMNAFMKTAWNGQNRIQVVQNGVKAE